MIRKMLVLRLPRAMVDLWLPILSLLIAADISLGLRDVRVTIPTAVQRGDNALLICNYDMENDTLYSIKWYKGKREFYRYTPKENHPMQSFPVMGIQVERNASNASQVTIEQVETNISGKFSCEVSVEPSFHTMIVSGDMEVVDIPNTKPRIEGLLSKYQPGDRIAANCSSDYSKPAANLTWTINEIEASPLQLTSYKLTKNDSNLEATVLGINFAITHQHFLRGKLKLRCTSRIHEIHEESIERFVEEDRPRILATSNGQNINMYQHVYDGEMNDQDEQYQKHYKADMSSSSAGIKASYLTICWITFYIGSTCTLLYSLRIGIS